MLISDDSSSSNIFLKAAPQVSTLMPIELTNHNYSLWKSLFVSILRASNMLDLAEGREQCPPQTQTLAHNNWIKMDQTLLTWINSSLSVNLLAQTAKFTSGRALWSHLETLLAENASTHVRDLRDRLQNLDTKEYFGDLNTYLKTAQEIADGLDAAGSPVGDSEYASCVLDGLPRAYQPFAASIMDRPEPVTRDQLQRLIRDHHAPYPRGFLVTLYVIIAVAVFVVMFLLARLAGAPRLGSFCFASLEMLLCVRVTALYISENRNGAPGASKKSHTE